MPILFPTSPTLGQVFTSGGRSWVWSGATWDSPTATNTLLAPYGMELVTSQSFTAQSAIIFNNVFSLAYDNYQIFTSITSGSGGYDMNIQFRAAGTNSATGYNVSYIQTKSGGASGFENLSTSSAHIGRMDSGGGFSVINLSNPARPTSTYGVGSGTDNVFFSRAVMFIHTNTVAYDGLQVNLNNATGSIRIYGMRN